MSSNNEPARSHEQLAAAAAAAADTTIKFHKSALKLESRRANLVEGSDYFREYFELHPAATTVTAPDVLVPGTSITPQVVEAALDYLHGVEIPEHSISKNSIAYLLVARALGMHSLEDCIGKQLSRKLERHFGYVASEIQVLELTAALHELWSLLGAGKSEVGNEVAAIVAGTVARACWHRLGVLNKSPEFMQLVKEVPQLGLDIIASVQQEATKSDEQLLVGLDSDGLVEDGVVEQAGSIIEGDGEVVLSGQQLEQMAIAEPGDSSG